jgi:hypothetical protein
MTRAATLRTYAEIFRKPRRDPATGALRPPTEICLAAAEALEFQADEQENAVRAPDGLFGGA